MKKLILSLFAISLLLMMSCGGGNSKSDSSSRAKDIGVGPIESISLGEIDEALAETGKEKFKTYCSACHKINKRYIGPAMQGVTEKRKPEWIMNMILNPDGMLKDDEEAKKLLAEFNAPMANQNLKEEDARAILEYFRLKDKK